MKRIFTAMPLFLLSVSLLISHPNYAEQSADLFFTAAEEAIEKGDDIAAEKFLEKSFQSGNQEALFYLIRLFHSSPEKISRDPQKSRELLELGVKNSYPIAYFYLGHMYLNGIGFPVDEKEGLRLVEIAAKQFPPAQTLLGVFRLQGSFGIAQDYEEAMRLLKLAADNGESMAMTQIGKMYADGLGVTKDSQEAKKWFELGAKNDDPESTFRLGLMYFKGQGVEKDTKKATEIYKIAANLGSSEALDQLAVLYASGQYGVEKNRQEALKLARLAAPQGMVSSQILLGLAYQEGDGVQQNMEEAAKWFRMAAEAGNPKAQFNLAVYYIEGSGVPKDENQALIWYGKAANQGHEEALQRAANIYFHRIIEKRATHEDMLLAHEFYSKASAKGNAVALLEFGYMHFLLEQYLPAYVMANLSATLGYKKGDSLRDMVLPYLSKDELQKARTLTNECIVKDYQNCKFK